MMEFGSMWNNILFLLVYGFVPVPRWIPKFRIMSRWKMILCRLPRSNRQVGFFAGGNAEHCFVTYEQPDPPSPLFMLRERFGPAGHLAT